MNPFLLYWLWLVPASIAATQMMFFPDTLDHDKVDHDPFHNDEHERAAAPRHKG